MIKLDDIKFGMLSENELYWLRKRVEAEETKRKQKPDEYIKVVRADDGAEGFYVPAEKFHEIKSVDLHNYIVDTLYNGSDIRFSLEEYEKNDYEENGKRYEWNFDSEDDDDSTEIEDQAVS